MKKIILNDIAIVINDRIESNKITLSQYVDTDSMLPNKNGKTLPVTLPSNVSLYKFQKNDILISNIRPYLKKIWLASYNGGCSTDILVFRAKDKDLFHYLFAVLLQDSFYSYNMLATKGVKMPRGIVSHILKFPITHININHKINIGLFILNIDNLLSINKNINYELEQLAKTLYNYWFVQFDFPDENGRPYKSSGGKMVWNEELKKEIPEGWEVKYIKDIAKTTAKNIIPTDNVLYKYYSLPSVSKNKSYIEEYGNNILSSKYIINHNCILVNKLNPLDSRVIFIPNEDNQICSTEFIVLQQENNFLRSYIYSTLCSEHFKIYCKQRISGAIHKRVAPQLVYNYKIPYNESIVNKYGNIIYNILFKINNAIQENRELTSLRDFLLPLLMNGQAVIEE